MSSWIIRMLLLTTIKQITGWHLCSKEKHPAHCLPCFKNGTDVYKCPDGCIEVSELKACNTTCSENCVESECGYDDSGQLRCFRGCRSPFTGRYCQERCPDGCLQCSQDAKCLQCQKGRFGDACEKKCNSCTDRTCDTKGSCKKGCIDGYFGPHCDKRCSARCSQCNSDTGQCTKCTAGWFGSNCQSDCRNCRTPRCSFKEGICTDGCESGFTLQGKRCQKIVVEKQEGPEEEKMSGLASIFQEEDYLLPAVGCLLVLLVVVAIIVIWRCKKNMAKEKENEKSERDVEDGVCNGLSPHPSLRRASTDIPKSDPLYKDIVEEAIRTHSCEEILKKHNLLDPNRPRLENKPLGSLRNRTGNLSVPFMTPIEEDEEENEEEDGVHMPNVGIIFTLDSPSEDEGGVSDQDCASTDVPGVQDESSSSLELPVTDSAGDLYIIQRGKPKGRGSLSVSVDYMDTSHSGRSTPMQPEMYSQNPHVEETQFSTRLSDHLDTFLTDRTNVQEGVLQNGRDTMDTSDSDALLCSNSLENNNTVKSRFGVPKTIPFFNGYNEQCFVNGDTRNEQDHIAFTSERQPMLSCMSDSSV